MKAKVSLLDLRAQHAPLRGELLAAMTRVLDSGEFVLGSEVDALEAELADALQVRHAITMSSGTDALLAALMALDIGPGAEVITTPFSFFATAGAIQRVGARPVFVDIEPETFNLSAAALEGAVSPRTRAVLPVHLFGQCADMAAIGAFARKHGLAVIEDAAQAIGASYRGGRAGSLGTIGCFSFFPTKNLGGLGDGGLCTTGDAEVATRLRILRVHGAARKYHHEIVGGNFRLDALQAATLRVKLPHLERWQEARRRNAAQYDDLLAGRVTTPRVGPDGHTYHQYTIMLPPERRDAIQRALAAEGIETAVYYPVPLSLQPCFAQLGYRPGAFPVAERAAASVLSLPIHPELTPEQIDTVATAILRALG